MEQADCDLGYDLCGDLFHPGCCEDIHEMKVLVACDFSGIVREAFIAKGHDAWSCDLLPTEIPGQHLQEDALDVLTLGWDLMIAHPPCTHLAVSGARWFGTKRAEQQEALAFVWRLMT